jgi:single-strand DNA-binding protein
MARSINKAIIIGNLTRDPEMRYTPDGQAVTTFGVATNRRWTSKDGEQKEDAEFHNLVAWGKLAEICSQLLKKGRRVYVEGRLQTRSWEGKDGVNRSRTEIVIGDMVALDPRDDGYAGKSQEVPEIEVGEDSPPAKPPAGRAGATKDKSKSVSKGKSSSAKATEDKNDEEIGEDEIPF